MKNKIAILAVGCSLAFGVSAVLAVAVLGYVGVVPPLARLMGTDKPRDLGVEVQQGDLEEAYQRHGTTQVAADPNQTIQQQLQGAEPNPVESALTEAQVSALIPQHHPVTDFQMRIHDDGSVEASGRLQLGRFPAYAQAISMPPDHVDIFTDFIDRMFLGSGDPAFYIRASGEVQDDRITMSLQRVEIGRLPLPGGFLRTYNDDIADYASDRLASVPHHHIESLSFENGQMLFQGTVPDQIPAY